MKKVQSPAVFEFKARVDNIADFLRSQGYDVKHMVLMEGIARYEGARDWRTYRAKLASSSAESASPVEMASAPVDDAEPPLRRYVYGLMHFCFDCMDRDVEIRFVFNLQKDSLVHLEIAQVRFLGWAEASDTSKDEFEDALRTSDYSYILRSPERAGFGNSDELPDWASLNWPN